MQRWAAHSPCGRYRWLLGRAWDPERPTLAVVALNPSIADGVVDDPTLRRIVGFARAWGFGAVRLANLYAWRATDPRALAQVVDPVGAGNDAWIAAALSGADRALAAWGARAPPDRVAAWRDRVSWYALGVTRAGAPRHPLYVPSCVEPVRWPADR